MCFRFGWIVIFGIRDRHLACKSFPFQLTKQIVLTKKAIFSQILPSLNKITKIIEFEERINEQHISIISYKNGIIVGDFGSKLNVI